MPGETIGIIGGGQLGQMMALSAKEMGFFVGVLDPTPDCPAAQVADWSITADYADKAAIEELVKKSSVITYEFENVDAEVIKDCVPLEMLPQGLELLTVSQNRENEKNFLSQQNLPVAAYKIVRDVSELEKAVEEMGFPSVLKTCSGGYDGKGQFVLKENSDINQAKELLNNNVCVLESWLSFEKEISVIVSGTADSSYEVFPVAENHHVNNVLQQSIVPATVSDKCEEKAKNLALTIAEKLNIKGTVTVEMFVTKEEDIMINEIAPRPHNSGHYSIEACNVSQFDAHIRGICGWPLPKIYQHQPAIMLNLLGEEANDILRFIPEKADWFFHFYGKKEVKVGRKMGHVTLLTDDINQSLVEIKQTKIWK